MARGGRGFGGGGRGGPRRRSRSPPQNNNRGNNNSNNNNNTTAASTSSAPAPPSNQAASSSTFELRRLVSAAFMKYPEQLAPAGSKDEVLPEVFKASDAASFYNPAAGETKQSALDKLKSGLVGALKSTEVVDWMMEKASVLVDPQPREVKAPAVVVKANNNNFNNNNTNNSNNSAPLLGQYQQQQAPPSYDMVSNNNNNNFIPRFNNNFIRQNQNNTPLALLPDPSDPKVLIIKDLPDDLNTEQNIRVTVANRANTNILKQILCEPGEKKRAILFCYDASQAMMLRSFPSGTVFIRAPDAKIVECDAPTWKHALFALRDKVLEKENLAMEEINKLTSEEEGIPLSDVIKAYEEKTGKNKTGSSSGTGDSAEQQQQQQQENQQSPEEIAAINELSQLQQQLKEHTDGVEKYQKELSLLESLGDSISAIPGQAERKKVVQGEVAKRTAQIDECNKKVQQAQNKVDSFDKTKQDQKEQEEQDRAAAEQEKQNQNNAEDEGNDTNDKTVATDGLREKKITSSTAQIENPRALLFFSAFEEAWSDAKILALLKYIPAVEPIHIWRAPNSFDICVEVKGGTGAVTQASTFLSYNDYVFCGLRVTRTRPQAN